MPAGLLTVCQGKSRGCAPKSSTPEQETFHSPVTATDFGLAKQAGAAGGGLTSTGQWVGTLNYIAPEQIEHGTLDAHNDVYALGCVLFHLLSGRVPFEGTDAQKMWGHTSKPVPPSMGSSRASRLPWIR